MKSFERGSPSIGVTGIHFKFLCFITSRLLSSEWRSRGVLQVYCKCQSYWKDKIKGGIGQSDIQWIKKCNASISSSITPDPLFLISQNSHKYSVTQHSFRTSNWAQNYKGYASRGNTQRMDVGYPPTQHPYSHRMWASM